MPVPGFALKVVLGEMADAALGSQRALPGQPLAHGYQFRYPEIDIAFRGIFGD
jgi:NAD dependent epimerase/dehydratase family enzyme